MLHFCRIVLDAAGTVAGALAGQLLQAFAGLEVRHGAFTALKLGSAVLVAAGTAAGDLAGKHRGWAGSSWPPRARITAVSKSQQSAGCIRSESKQRAAKNAQSLSEGEQAGNSWPVCMPSTAFLVQAES